MSSPGRSEEAASEGNRYTRAARVLAKNDKISMKLADRAFMSESTAARCLEAWRACVAELIEAGRLLDPVKKKQLPRPTRARSKARALATETAVATPPAVEPVGTAGAI